MESMFSLYFSMGRDHILTLEAYDHVAFLVALCAPYPFSAWKKLLILVTAFTIGHSLTLSIAAFHIFTPNYDLVERLIPATIILTAVWNIWQVQKKDLGSESLGRLPDFGHYGAALVFGLVHGLAFSNQFITTEPVSTTWSLFSFNLGIELGQLLIVSGLLVCSYLWQTIFKKGLGLFTLLLSVLALLIGVYMLF